VQPNAAPFDPPLERFTPVGGLLGLALGFARRPVRGVENLLRPQGGLVCSLFLLMHAQQHHALDHFLDIFTYPLLEGG
jgi:hypothetical protein